MVIEPAQGFKPYVSAADSPAEFTPKAIPILGSIFGLIFGAATVYLALTAGPHRVGVDPDRGVGDRGLQASASRPSSKTTSCRRSARRANRSPPASPSRFRR